MGGEPSSQEDQETVLGFHPEPPGTSGTSQQQLTVSASTNEDLPHLQVTFTADTLDGQALPDDAYSWDFGDGTVGTGRRVTHVYARAGIYTAVVCLSTLPIGTSEPICGSIAVEVGDIQMEAAEKANNLKTAAAIISSTPTSSKEWQNAPFEAQNDTFTVKFDAVPHAAKIDGLTWLSSGPSTGYKDMAVVVRFNNAGRIDCRNGHIYTAVAPIPYKAGQTYQFRVEIDVPTRTYSAYVTPAGGTELLVAKDFAFRTEQASVTSLDHWGLQSSSGSHTVSNFMLVPQGPSSSPAWQNTALAPQSGSFTAEFDAVPHGTNIDGLTGLSAVPGTWYDDYSILVRFNVDGRIDCRNGNVYAAATDIPYKAGHSYHFRLEVNVPARTYSVYVTPAGGTEQLVARDAAFRTEQASVSNLANWGICASIGSHTVSNFKITAQEPPKNQPPVAHAGPDQTVTDTDGDGSQTVTLDGSASSDPDGTITSYRWTEGSSVLAEGVKAQATLPVGVHTITLTVTDDQGETATDTVTIKVVAAGRLGVSPAGNLTASGQAGGPFSPASASYTLSNSGGESIQWAAHKTQNWVTLSKTGGSLASGATDTVTVWINSAANTLSAGSYNDTITFTNSTNGTGSTTRSVSLTVEAPMDLLDLGLFLDTGPDNSLARDDSLFQITQRDGAIVIGTTSTATNIHSHYIGADSHGWTAYEYTGRMLITHAGGGIGITVLSDYPNSDSYYRLRAFNHEGFHIAPHPHEVVTMSGGTTESSVAPVANVWYRFRLQVEALADRTTLRAKVWLDGQAEPTDWQIDCYDAHANRLHAGTVGLWSMGSGNKYWSDLRVSGIAKAPSALSVSPTGGLTATGNAGGPFSPSEMEYTLTNTGYQPINWMASKSQNWISLSKTGGTLAAGASETVTVSISNEAATLPAGGYNDTVAFTNVSSGAGNTSRPVSLLVEAPQPGALLVSPAGGLTAAGDQGGPISPLNAAYTLTNTGGQPINWTIGKTQSWVSLSKASGTLAPGAIETVTVAINSEANALPAGSYTDTITFTNATNSAGNTIRTVSLSIKAQPGALSVSPAGGVTVSGDVGGPFSPASAAYTLTNTGGQPINWTAGKTEAWISLSKTSGTLAAGAKETVTVSINSAANELAAGSYADTIVFTNATNGTGNTTRAVNLTANATSTTCYESLATWQNYPMPARTSSFAAEFNAVAGVAGTDGLIGLSATPGTGFADYAVLVRFNVSGYIDARNGDAYAADTPVAYTPGKRYHFRVVVNVPARNYSVYVRPDGAGSETLVASNCAFRTEQNFTTTFSNWGLVADIGSLQVCDFNSATIIMPGELSVTPSAGLASSGKPGGPFSPANATYTLTNTGGQPINWTAGKTQNWITLSKTEGTLAAGATDTVTVSFNSAANSLAVGNYADTISFTNATNNSGNTTRPVNLAVATTDATYASSVSQWGITWTFDKSYQVGKFVNGDWWVVGPIVLKSIQVVPVAGNPSTPTGGRNGFTINPPTGVDSNGKSAKATHAYDSRAAGYNAALQPTLPATIGINSSIVSTISRGAEADSGGAGTEKLKTAAVLTVLGSPPPVGSFRPPYVGKAKPIYSSLNLRRDLLLSLPKVSGTPSISALAAKFQRPWIDTQFLWSGKGIHPIDNMPPYGADIVALVGEGALRLQLDDAPADKEPLLINYVQVGIDLFGLVENGMFWPADGGHASGRKFPILFAGLMLNNQAMLSIGSRTFPYYGPHGGSATGFGEDCQTFYDSKGNPKYGIRHCEGNDDLNYQLCCTGRPWLGQTLAARLLGLVQYWNHNAYFDYVDWYVDSYCPTNHGTRFCGSYGSTFNENMWLTYRKGN
ncbi:MAG TPA: PKD domain-containing protein [Phycisphaerae bacterium]|nr:PKD domain-containing protein [Phycisphaerae bacterium]